MVFLCFSIYFFYSKKGFENVNLISIRNEPFFVMGYITGEILESLLIFFIIFLIKGYIQKRREDKNNKKSKYPKFIHLNNFNDRIKGYNKLKASKFEEHEIWNRKTGKWIKTKIGNKKIKYWKHVSISDNSGEQDEYIPIFFKNRRKKK